MDTLSNVPGPNSGRDMELLMIYKISPLPTGRQVTPLFQRGGKRGNSLLKRETEKAEMTHSTKRRLKNIVKQPDVLTKLQEQAKKAGTNKLSLEDIDAEIKAFRKGL